MRSIFIIIVAFVMLNSCDRQEEFIYFDLSKSIPLNVSESVIEFDAQYPVGLSISDSLMFVLQIRSDYAITVFNRLNKNRLASLGPLGHGPDELISPNFILSIDNKDILLDDGNLRRILKIDRDSLTLAKYIDYPEPIFISSEINLSDNYIVGRKVDALEGKMLFIYNRNMESIHEVECFPKLVEKVRDYNYTYAPALAFNEDKGRIVAGMYFFDMFHLYDLKGNRIKTCCFSMDCIPNVDKNTHTLHLNNGYSGIVRVFPTEDYCYLLRRTVDHSGNVSNKLIQINWEGELIHSYALDDQVSGQFYVDEEENRLYAIRNYVNSAGNEIFAIMSYGLPMM